MAEKKLDKGTPEWQFFQDFWKFRQKYYIPDNEEDWIVEMMHAGESIIEKYRNTDFAKFAQGLILLFSTLNDASFFALNDANAA